ncbi:MAG: hypothetical protein R2685_11545 [Candidatus Nitrosocosmicus sp.]|jgi:hypothetical protein|nr:hypothetical protein [Candidatus Nitrosocosmicus sp.]
MDKKIKMSILSIFVAAALVGSIVAISNIDNKAFAGGDNHHDKKKKKSNEAFQGLGQDSTTLQQSGCGSDGNTVASCNNLAFTLNANDGNNALGQQ